MANGNNNIHTQSTSAANRAKAAKAPLTDAEKAAKAKAKADKFVEIAQKRMTAATKQIALIGNLSSKSSYTYTDEQVSKMGDTLRKAVSDTMARFNATSADKPSGFTF